MTGLLPALLRGAEQPDPISVEAYRAAGGFAALERAVSMEPQAIVEELTAARLLGRGGAAYPAGRKWSSMLRLAGEPKYIVCNADEGEPGTFKDRALLQYAPLRVIEGMTIAARVFGARRGFIYIRGEYRPLQQQFRRALEEAARAGLLGSGILGHNGFDYNITVLSGGGAYVCGESSALLNSAEGKAGRPRVKPPHLAEVGLYGKPTLVNNVESFALVTLVLALGPRAFLDLGTPQSGGTKLISVSGHVKHRGVYELGLGKVTLGQILDDPALAGGSGTGRPIQFVHLGGQSGPIAFPEQFHIPYDHDSLNAAGLSIGSGAVVALDDSVCLVDYCRKVMEFFVHESCGKCAPCRLGTTRCLELLTKLCDGRGEPGDVARLEETVRQIAALSACGLGQSVDKALLSCLRHRREEFLAHERGLCPCGGCAAYGR